MQVFIIAALTADGYIARNSSHHADWTSREDKQLFVRLTKEARVMVMGSSTFRTIGRALPDRRTIIYTTKPKSIIAKGVETTQEPPKKLIERLRAEGAHGVAICGGAQIYSLFMNSGLVDELYLSFEPKLFGSGVALLSNELDADLELMESTKLNDNTVLLHYRVLH